MKRTAINVFDDVNRQNKNSYKMMTEEEEEKAKGLKKLH